MFPHAIGVDLDYPGYDGCTLPFPDESQDTVFSSHALEHIGDYRNALRDWFRVLRIGGYLVCAVPHQFLYERRAALPSRFNGDHKRFYTAGSLLAEVEDALDPLSYRVRHVEDNDAGFDYSIPPESHAGGCYELVLVLQRIRRPDYADAILARPVPASHTGRYLQVGSPEPHEPVIVFESETPARRILVLKLDHRGDFIMATTAFKALREGLAGAHITLVCGSWSEADAKQSGFFDEVITVDFFPEVASQAYTDFYTSDGTLRFTKAVVGKSWDLAIDLRVDTDSRHLLKEVDAKHRAGFGTVHEFPFLDIFLPYVNPTVENRAYRKLFPPTMFSHLVGRHEGYAIVHDNGSEQRPAGDILTFGPWSKFEGGLWQLEILVEPLQEGFDLTYDICSDAGTIILQFGKLEVRAGAYPSLVLKLDHTVELIELRLRMAAAGQLPPFRFLGLKADKKGSLPALHQQEMQMLLASLVNLRMQNPFAVTELPG